MHFKQRMTETDFFKKLDTVKKDIASKRQNWLTIENGYNIAKNIGLEKWEEQTQYNFVNRGIIRELIKNDEL